MSRPSGRPTMSPPRFRTAPSSSPTSRPPAAAAAAIPGFRRPAPDSTCPVVLAPATRARRPGARDDAADAGRRRRAGRRHRARPPACRVDLKWPNDLLVSPAQARRHPRRRPRRSTGGRSATASTSLATAFPPELRERATSLESELGRRVDRDHRARRDARRALAPLRGPARRPVRCYSRRLAPPRPGRVRRARHVDDAWTARTPASRPASTIAERCSCRSAIVSSASCPGNRLAVTR